MTEVKREENVARPSMSRAFLKRLNFALPSLQAQFIFWSLTVGGTALDLWSKKAVFDWLMAKHPDGFSIIDGFLQLVIALNDGAAFGIASGQRYLLAVISVIALIVIFAVFFFSQSKQKLVHIALGLFSAGICGNLYDRIFNDGLVRDFIDVVYWPGRHWPAFNVADSMLCIGMGLVLISGFFTERSCRKRAQQHE
ncbi:MAG: signal peptidase II [Planctomycetota bacterium]